MGRRSINTTKSGKYMNPTDQARKEARKRELKKNKKQRIAVRHAVLKSKDALQLLEEASILSGPPPGLVTFGRKPPGPPPLPVPDLSDSESEDADGVGDPMKQRRIRFADIGNEVQAPGFASGTSHFPKLSDTVSVPTSQIPLPPAGAGLPGFPGLIRPEYPGAPGNQIRMVMHNPGGAVLSAPPTLNPHPDAPTADHGAGGTTIEAKPQLKNLIGDATRFVPTSLKVRRTVKDAQGRLIKIGGGVSSTGNRPRGPMTAAQRIGSIPGGALGVSGSGTTSKNTATSKDAAYEEFMREMEGLLYRIVKAVMEEAGRWQLINATLNGDGHRLRSLLSKKPSIDLFHACQLFHLAAACGSTENLKTLLAFIPSLNVNCKDEVRHVFVCPKANVAVLKALKTPNVALFSWTPRPSLHSPFQTGCTALHKAASAGHREIIHFLIYHGAQVDVQEYLHGNSPLHEAASKGFSRSVEALCLSRASPNLQNKVGRAMFHRRHLMILGFMHYGSTPLHIAAQNGHKQCTRILIFTGADIGAPNKNGDTCLHIATRYGRAGVVRILLTAKANVMATNRNLDTVLHVAAELKRTKIARSLIEAISNGATPVSSTLSIPGGILRKRNSLPACVPPSPAQSALWIRNAQGEKPVDVARRKGNNDLVTFFVTRMNEIGQSAHYENHAVKSLPYTDSNRPRAETPKLHMSSDLIYLPMHKGAGFKLSSKPQVGTCRQREISLRSDLSDQMTQSFTTLSTSEGPAFSTGILKTKMRSLRGPLCGGLFKRENQATFSLDDSFHKSLVSDRLRQNPLPQDSDSTSADVSSIHLPVDPFTSANNINGNNAARPAIHHYARAGHAVSVQRSQPLPLLGQNSAPRRLGVRFDLDGEKAEQTTSSPRHHLATQLYRDLAGNLKKGPVSSPSACNCVQRQAEYLAGKVSHFVPCSVHAYLDFRASEANPLPPNQPVARKHSERVNPPSKVLTRSRSDESLSVNAKKAGAKPAAPNDSVPVQVEKKPNNTPLSDVCMGSPSTRPISVNYEDASGWFRGEKLNQAPLQHTKAKDESDLPQKVSKSKSYSEQLTVAEATPSAALTNGCSTTTMGRQTVASPLYMSCHNIDGKMGLSVGCGPQAILSAP
ncbi:unnamed protein product [Mesocestoides corti]|uniref:Wbp11/ELF5/Saf1 N-terminal domain-containing protein n=1 Tax=Mesocestoides corti TaxID=53468 RepID=A0A158QTP3_MESCO|nr:unnamed protein product [Mesocestoides corti]